MRIWLARLAIVWGCLDGLERLWRQLFIFLGSLSGDPSGAGVYMLLWMLTVPFVAIAAIAVGVALAGCVVEACDS